MYFIFHLNVTVVQVENLVVIGFWLLLSLSKIQMLLKPQRFGIILPHSTISLQYLHQLILTEEIVDWLTLN